MFKKLLSIATLLIVLGMNTTVKAVNNLQRIDVKTAQEFVAALKVDFSDETHTQVRGADIHLLCDLDFSDIGSDGTFIEDSYICSGQWFGKISGAGVGEDGNETVFALKNLKYTLFEKLVDAEISDLLIAFSSFEGRDTSSGMLADDCENTSIKSIMFLDIVGTGNSDAIDCDNMGTAVGYAKNSTFAGLMFLGCKLVTDGQNLGHVAGYAENCKIIGCVTDAESSLWADGNSTLGFDGNAYVGGICGEANNCQIINCFNMSLVSSDDDRIGGIVGYGCHGTIVTDCKNGGVVKHCTKDGIGRSARLYEQKVLLGWSIGLTAAAVLVTGGTYWLGKELPPRGDRSLWEQIRHNWSQINETYSYEWGSGSQWDIKFAMTDGVKFGKAIYEGYGMVLGFLGNFAMYVITFFPELTAIVAAVVITCYFTLAIYNSLTSDPDEMGGIAGTMEDGTIIRCVNAGPVVCLDDDCGGIVGQLDGSTVESCVNRSFVRGKTDVGGIVGYAYHESKIKNCLNLGAVTSSGEEGYYGIVGELDSNCTASDNYYLYEENKNHTICESVTQDKMASGWVAKQLNDALIAEGKNPLWRQNVGGENADFAPYISEDDRPIVTSVAAEGSYSVVQNITNGGDFVLACANPLAQISLKDNVDLSGASVLMSNFQHPFRGHINGNGYSICNFHYQSSEEDKFLTNDDEDNNRPHDIALFPRATGATFENFVIDGFNITQKDENLVYAYREGLLVGNADHCIFRNITIRNSQIKVNEDEDPKWLVGGLVGLARNTSSSSDDISYFDNVTVESTCSFSAFIGNRIGEAYLGGIAGQASKTVFDHCHNASSLSADDDFVGGICGYAAGCGFVGCLNSGSVVGQDYVGGIVGRALSCGISESVNTGKVSGDDADNDYLGGIVGSIDGSSSVKYCLGFGEVNNAGDYCGGIEGKGYGVENVDCANNHWYYYLNGSLQTDFKAENTTFGYTPEDLYSGKFAYYYTNGENKRYLYQSLDNDPYLTDLPVPMAAAGEVYQNHLCFTEASEKHYSNLYQNPYGYIHNGQAHLDFARWGFCTVCGNVPNPSDITFPTEITINNADDLMTLSKGVSMGVDYSNTTISLANDIDFDGVTDFMPIGTTIKRPFRGTFNGNAHRIKNLHIKRTSNATGVGLFGVVTGQTRIEGVIMDKSCSVDGNNSLGVGGLVGCVMTDTDHDSAKLILYYCGNEANVNGGENVAGLVGGVYDKANDGAATTSCALRVSDCYNAGTISGNKVCAALVGYGHLNLEATYSYNIGYVTGSFIENHFMVNYNKEKATHAGFSRLYQLEGMPADENIKETVTANQIILGDVAEMLNIAVPVNYRHWYQNLGTDLYPTPVPTPHEGIKNIYHERSMSSDWGTAILPYAVQTNDDVQLYALKTTDINGTDASITLEEIESVDENTPFFFKKKNASATSVCFDIADGSYVTLPADDATSVSQATNADGWSLTGNYRTQSYLTNVYFMAQNKVWYAEDPIEVPSFRAYLSSKETSSSNKPIRILVHGENSTTQIGEIRDGEVIFFDQPIYNLSGQRVSKDSKGILITNGKKVIIK